MKLLFNTGKSGLAILAGLAWLRSIAPRVAGWIVVRAALVVGTVALSPSVSAQDGARRVMSDLISPALANEFYPVSEVCTYGGVQIACSARKNRSLIDPRVTDLAQSLNHDPDAIYEYVRNNVESLPSFGLQKGAVGALLGMNGTAFDQAQLMVDMLRSADDPDTVPFEGTEARYKLGLLTLDGAEFAELFGISDAEQACRLLANGGLPATVNGNSTCIGLASSEIGNVSFLHVWVEAKLEGQWYAFDPYYKAHEVIAGVGLPSLGGAVTGSQVFDAATDGMTSGAGAGFDWVSNVNGEALSSILNSSARAKLTAARTNKVDGPIDILLGKRSIIRTFDQKLRQQQIPNQGETEQGGTAPYRVWTGEIPDSFRTALRVQAVDTQNPDGTTSYGLDYRIYADEFYGSRLTLRYIRYGFENYGQPGGSTGPVPIGELQKELVLYGGHTAISEIDETISNAAQYKLASATFAADMVGKAYPVKLSLDAPYAANSGAYGDHYITKQANTGVYAEIILAVGGDTFAMVDAYERAAAQHLDRYEFTMGESCVPSEDHVGGGMVFSDQCAEESMAEYGMGHEGSFHIAELRRDRDFIWRRWSAKTAKVAEYISKLAGAEVQLHHAIGLVLGSGNEHDSSTYSGVSSSLDVDTTFSVSVEGATEQDAVARVFSAFANHNEGGRTASRSLLMANEVTNQKIYRIHDDVFSNLPLSNYSSTDISELKYNLGFNSDGSTVTDGASRAVVIAASKGSCQHPGWKRSFHVGMSSYPPLASCGGIFDKNAAKAWYIASYVGSGESRLAHMSAPNSNSFRPEYLKGGTSEAGQADGVRGNPDLQTPELAFAAGGVAKSVDLSTGDLTFTLPPEVSTGSGEFPYSLAFQRSYNSGSRASLPLGQGWTHNFDQFLTISDSEDQLLGRSSLRAALPTLTAISAALEMVHHTDTSRGNKELIDLVSLSVITEWLSIGAYKNLITVNAGDAGGQFILMVDGTYEPGPTSSAVLDYSITQDSLSGVDKLGGFILKSKNGALRQFLKVEPEEASLGPVRTLEDHRYLKNVFLPSGASLEFTYRGTTGTLQTVKNHMGRRLDFEYADSVACSSTATHPQLAYACNKKVASWNRLQGVFNEADEGVKVYTGDSSGAGGGANNFVLGGSVRHTMYGTSNTDPIFKAEYGYQVQSPAHPNGEFTRYTTKLQRLLPYGETEQPYFEATYHLDRGLLSGRVQTIADAKGNAWRYYPSNRRASIIDPEGNETTHYFDEDRRLIRTFNALGHETRYELDRLGRVYRTVKPDGSEVLFEYDLWNNVRKETRKPKPGSSLPDYVVTRIYIDKAYTYPSTVGLSVTSAQQRTVNINVLDYEVVTSGTVQRRTDYLYHANGMLHKVKGPCVNPSAGTSCSDAERPVTAYSYYAESGLLDTVTDPEGIVTKHGYDAKGNLKEVIVDNGDKKLRTVYFYDKVGNVCRTVGPRASAGLDGGYDAACDSTVSLN